MKTLKDPDDAVYLVDIALADETITLDDLRRIWAGAKLIFGPLPAPSPVLDCAIRGWLEMNKSPPKAADADKIIHLNTRKAKRGAETARQL